MNVMLPIATRADKPTTMSLIPRGLKSKRAEPALESKGSFPGRSIAVHYSSLPGPLRSARAKPMPKDNGP